MRMPMRALPVAYALGRIALLVAVAMSLSLALLPISPMARAARAARAARQTMIGGCPLFPANNIWNHAIATLPTHRLSATYIASIGATGHMHADFGAGLYDGEPIGIPYIVAPASQTMAPVRFDYADESDPGPYPIPSNAPIEGGAQSTGDRHVLVVKSGVCTLSELYAAYPQRDSSWQAGSGAIWSLTSNALRPKGWTSADAAGLPILPGLVRYDEVAAGAITHALRFTVSKTQRAYLWPARHQASSNGDTTLPPMGLRLRLKASFDISSYSAQNRVILTALKTYGMLVADNGSDWFLSGAPDSRWNNDDLGKLRGVPGSAFEAVDVAGLQVSADSGQALGADATIPIAAPVVGATMGPATDAPTTSPRDLPSDQRRAPPTSTLLGWGFGALVLLATAVALVLWLRARRWRLQR